MHELVCIMMTPATAEQLEQILGELDPFTIEKILETRATEDEVAEALADVEAERRAGERRDPTTARVAQVRAVLEELPDDADDEAYPQASAQDM